jgi:hypothetical protein
LISDRRGHRAAAVGDSNEVDMIGAEVVADRTETAEAKPLVLLEGKPADEASVTVCH